MGFKRSAYRLVWPDGDRWAGLEVRMRGMSIAELGEVSAIKGATGIKELEPFLDIMSGALISWNYEDEDGVPIPVADFREQDATLLLAIVSAWTEVVGGVPAPLSPGSSAGKPLAEESIPMEIPSESHPSLSTPS